MPRQLIPIHTGLNLNIEEVGLEVSAAKLIDCFVDLQNESIVVNRRPGLKSFCDLGTSAAVDGLFWWEEQDMVIAVSNGNTYKITDSSGTFAQLTGSFFTAGKKVIWADFGSNLYAADQGKINKISTAAVTEMADADAPATVSHVAFLNQYLLANLMGGRECHRSDVGAPDTWGGNYFSAEAQYDDLRAVLAANLELYLLGDRTLEVWYDDGASPFSRLVQGYIQSGTIAPYTFIWCGPPVNSLAWLDENRKVVLLQGRTTQPISTALDRYLQNYATVTDAMADFIVSQGHSFLAMHFPTEGETLVHDFTSGLWQQWAYWNSVAAQHDRFRGNCHTLAQGWGKVLIGDRANGKVYELDESTYQDDGDDIRSLVRTGHISRKDSGVFKRCRRVDFRAKKTAPGGGTTISLVVRYRDNGETIWSNETTITLSAASGETDYIGRLNRLGRYKTRQWEMYMTDNAPVALLPPVEDFEYQY